MINGASGQPAHSDPENSPPARPDGNSHGAATQTTVTISFRPDLITRWQNTGTAPGLLLDLGDQLVAMGYSLTQVHPGAADVQLASWFEVSTPTPEDADRVAAFLRGHPAVAGAFIKPPDAPPG